MPVVKLEIKRFARMVRSDRKTILYRLPYIGLDIESSDDESVRVEYSPNRPDFGTDFGIARALLGLLGKEVGFAKYPTHSSEITIKVDRRLSSVRPYIACATATGLSMDDEDIRQLISLQEDLHNGLGRRRRAVAIGLHDLDTLTPPLRYQAVSSTFKFAPLGAKKETSVKDILASTPEGRSYGRILAGTKLYPMIIDSKDEVLSFPPVINGNATKVSTRTKNLLIDVTSTDMKAGDEVLAILTTTLAEAGARIGSVSIRYQRSRTTPDLSPTEIPLQVDLVREVLGLELNKKMIVDSLRRSRLDLKGGTVLVPRYRIDLLHPVDIAEEVALGYGVDRITPLYPASNQPGSFNAFEQFLDRASTLMAGAGMIEMMTYELVDEESLYRNFGRRSDTKISVQNPRSRDHSVLRDSLLPVLMAALSGNVKEEYPQRVFEIGRIYRRDGKGVEEAWHLGCLVAHAQASYSEAKMYLESACKALSGNEALTKEAPHWAFDPGRSAAVKFKGEVAGSVGEVRPEALSAFGLNVPVSGFELDLSQVYKRLK